MQPKKIVLIRPYLKTNYELTPPLGILSIGSVLMDKGYRVDLIDLMAGEDYRKSLEAQIEDCLFVGISVMTAHIPSALSISKFIKGINKKVPVVWGGIHPTLYPEQTIANHFVDIVVKGEGDYICLDLTRTLLEGGRNLEQVPGLLYKDGQGNVISSHNTAKPVDLNGLPFLNYDLIDIEKYINKNVDPTYSHSHQGIIRRHLPVVGGVGCKFRCAFCVNPIVHKRRQRVKSADRLLDEIEYLMERFNARYFYLRDEDFFGDRGRVMQFLDGIEKRNLSFKWNTNVRAAYFRDNYINKDFLYRMERLGLYQLAVGAESGSQKVLNILKKDIRVEDMDYMATIAKDTNIVVTFSFMIGIPGENLEDILKTIKFIRKLKKTSPRNAIIGPQLYRPYPGASLYELCREKGFDAPKSLTDWCTTLDRYSGYLLPRHLPWLSQSDSFNLIYLYSRAIFKNRGVLKRDAYIFLKIPLLFLLKFTAELRIRLNFWSLPIENVVQAAMLKIHNSLKHEL